MAEVAITLKLTASEFQTLREELRAHTKHLRDEAVHVKHPEKGKIQTREAACTFILEKLG